jgi:hypothetical protein
MGAKIPVPIPTKKKLELMWWAVFDPNRFEEEEKADNKKLESAAPDNSTRVNTIRKAYRGSFLLMITAVIAGVIIGYLSGLALYESQLVTAIFGVLGAALLLWTTVANRGWEIASFATITLGERLNVWIFRTYYWFGTALLVAAAVRSMGS